jgi:hypothetical protein
MTSVRQRAANKANAKRSTGPRSPKGKARSRLNSQKHGLTAEHILIHGEDASECKMFATEIIENLMPVGRLEQALTERVAALLWRLNRVSLFEAAVVEARDNVTADHDPLKLMVKLEEERRRNFAKIAARYSLDEEEKTEPDQEKLQDVWSPEAQKAIEEALGQSESGRAAIGRALIHDSENGDALGKVLRYETSLNNTLARTMSMLMTLQSSRLDREQLAKKISISTET